MRKEGRLYDEFPSDASLLQGHGGKWQNLTYMPPNSRHDCPARWYTAWI